MVNVGTVNANAGLTVQPSGFAAYAAALRAAESNVTSFSNTSRDAFKGVSVGLAAVVVGIAGTGVKIASSMQDAGTTLTTVYGNLDLAKEKFQWLQQFAASTPFEFPELLDATIKLKAYGIDAEKYMTTIGNTASAMGKDVNQVVEAVADAQTGEFERLKEFGIKAIQVTKANYQQFGVEASAIGQTALTYTDKLGKEQVAIVDRNNREMVTSTVMSIWNPLYEGAMEKRSKTLSGLVSTLKDNLSMGLANLVGYDMKNMEVASASLLGVLQGLAGVAVDVSSGFTSVGPAGRVFVTVIAAGVVAVGLLTAGMMVWTAVSGMAVTANLTLGASLAAAFWPVTAIIVGVGLLAVALYELNEKTGILSKGWEVLKDVFTIVSYYVKGAVSDLSSAVTTKVTEITTALKNMIPQSLIDDVTKFYNWASGLIGKVTDALHGKATSINAADAAKGGSTGSAGSVVNTSGATAQVRTLGTELDALTGKADKATQKVSGINNVNLSGVTSQVAGLGGQADATGQKAESLNVTLNETGRVSINGTIGQFVTLDGQGRSTHATMSQVFQILTSAGNVSADGTIKGVAMVDSQGRLTKVTTEQLAAILKQAGSTSMSGTVSGIQSIASAWQAAKSAASQYAAAAMEMGHSINQANKAIGQSYSSSGGLGSVSPDGVKVLKAGESARPSSSYNTTINNTYNSPVASDHKSQLAITRAG